MHRKVFLLPFRARHVERMVEPLREGEPVAWHSLGLEFDPVTIASARDRGLTDKQARRLEKHDPEGRRILVVVHRSAGMPGKLLFREGDMILSIDGDPRHASTGPSTRHSWRSLRDRSPARRRKKSQSRSHRKSCRGRGTTRAILWSGALLQAPHNAISAQFGMPLGGVYVSRHWYGSPATRYQLAATSRIVAVDGNLVTDLDRISRGGRRQE